MLCTGALMIVIDGTIVNVALPSIGRDLGFSETGLAWVVNAYLLVFGGFLLLGGRLGDVYGARRVFVGGIVLFTLASLACGLASSQPVLIVARALQGLGGAVVDAVALALIVRLFPEPVERAKAMGVYGFVCSAGGSIGVLAGGFITSAWSWQGVFLVNVPIGVLLLGLCFRLLPADDSARGGRLDWAGAGVITTALLCAVYAVIDADRAGWRSLQTVTLIAAALVLLVLLRGIETRVAVPLMPPALLRQRNVRVANAIGVLWCTGMFAWFFLAALFLQRLLGYSPWEVGLVFLPANLVMAACSLGFSAWLVNRYGFRRPLFAGLSTGVLALLWFARLPLQADVWIDVLPPMLLLGVAGGVAFNPLLMAAMSEVPEADAGLASGLVNTAFMMGGAFGLAVLVAVAAAASGAVDPAAGEAVVLAAGYRLAFLVAAGTTALAALLTWALREARPAAAPAMSA